MNAIGQCMRSGRLIMRVVFFAVLLAVFAVCSGLGLAQDSATTQTATSKLTSQPTTQQRMEKVAEKAAEKAAEKITEKVAEKAAEKVAEKAAEKAVEKAAEVKAAKEELKSKRPDEWFGPTEVRFFIFVADIDEIADADQNFMANIFLGLEWNDRRLAAPGSQPRQLPLVDVWNPRVLLANRQGLVSKSLPDVVHVKADGTVTYYQRYTGRLSQPLRLSDFPMDTHSFTIQFTATGYEADELTFSPAPVNRKGLKLKVEGGAMADRLSLPDWKVLSYDTTTEAFNPIEGANSAGFAFEFIARRYVAYYLWQVLLPLGVIVIMSWAAFWVDPANVGVRLGVASSSILTLIAHRFVLASLLPRLPYMTRMDYLSVGSTIMVLLALIVVLWSASLGRRGLTDRANRVNIWARFGFPGAFLTLLIWFISCVCLLM
jgi:hypothetical protein